MNTLIPGFHRTLVSLAIACAAMAAVGADLNPRKR